MASKRQSRSSNFRPSPQTRAEGTGAGRPMYGWKRKLPWLVITAEQLYIVHSGSMDAVLEDRNWILNWNLTTTALRQDLERIYPGIGTYLDEEFRAHETPWEQLLHNRVYKMFYNGTSARGNGHDPYTRAAISHEHWRNWDCRSKWEGPVLELVSKRLVKKDWRQWLC